MDCEPSHFRPVAVLASDHKSGRLRRCAVLFLIAAFFLLPLVGCRHASRQTMSSLWGPQGRRLETNTDSGVPPQTEPSVSANAGASVATQQSDSTDLADPSKASTAERIATRGVSSLQTIAGVVAAAKPTFTDRNAADAPSAELGQQEVTTAASIVDEGGQEQLERLEAALDRDAEQTAGVRHLAGSTHDVRLRVDALLEKSRRLFDLGQLREARQAAKVAHDLGDSARLDYAPDEERPIDLVLRIDDRIKEASEQGESPTNAAESLAKDLPLPPEFAVANANATVNVANTATANKAMPPAKSGDNESPNKPRKGWTQSLGVFGGNRKPTTPAPAAIQPASTPSAAPEAPAVQLALDTDTAAPEANDGAVVQANRSLTLATTPRAVEPESIPDHSGETESLQREFEPPTESTESPIEATSFSVNQPDLASDLRSWPTDSSASKTLQIDEPTPTSADLHDVEPLPPFRDMAGPAPTRTDDADAPHECRSSDYGWPIGIALFVGCSLVAVFWYRRGAV